MPRADRDQTQTTEQEYGPLPDFPGELIAVLLHDSRWCRALELIWQGLIVRVRYRRPTAPQYARHHKDCSGVAQQALCPSEIGLTNFGQDIGI